MLGTAMAAMTPIIATTTINSRRLNAFTSPVWGVSASVTPSETGHDVGWCLAMWGRASTVLCQETADQAPMAMTFALMNRGARDASQPPDQHAPRAKASAGWVAPATHPLCSHFKSETKNVSLSIGES
jgi:hypothetical protein